jgi:hypothetical protein
MEQEYWLQSILIKEGTAMSAQPFSREYLEKVKRLEEDAAGVYAVPNYQLKNQDELTKDVINQLKKKGKTNIRNLTT